MKYRRYRWPRTRRCTFGAGAHIPRLLPRDARQIRLRFTLHHGWEVTGPHLWGIHYLTPWGAWIDARRERGRHERADPPGSARWMP